MGQEIETSHFTKSDFVLFKESMEQETVLLENYFAKRAFSNKHGIGGFELEAWLVDKDYNPTPINVEYLEALNDPLVGAELAMFNVELNTVPYKLTENALSKMHKELEKTWDNCNEVAKQFDAKLIMAGILPTVRESQLVPQNMSRMKRYRALNDQVIQRREGAPVTIDIQGRERLRLEHSSVMLEAATAAFQIQFQVGFSKAVRFYNASVIASAPIVAVTANSPFMFGKDLWAETRIPVFEQSLAENSEGRVGDCAPNRVTLGCDYMHESLMEIFKENLEKYETLLPMNFDDDISRLSHVRLHNGTIWRWNRALIGFSDDGTHHLRIENRVIPSGPSLMDTIANAAFYYGLAEALSTITPPLEKVIPFAHARANFYSAAKDGLGADVRWSEGKKISIKYLIIDELLPLAESGLKTLGLDNDDISLYLGIIERRAISGKTGTAWQRAYLAKHKCGSKELTAAYYERQKNGAPVHEWPV